MKIRRLLNITSRSSSITNSFVQAIIPNIAATPEEQAVALGILGMSPKEKSCIYCGGEATDWDHLRPLVRGKRPTGYIDDVRNRVPSCNRCNQSKSGADWRKWMMGSAPGSPTTRGIKDVEARVRRLEAFEKWGAVQSISLSEFVDDHQWNTHWENLEAIQEKMRESQKHAESLKAAIRTALDKRRK